MCKAAQERRAKRRAQGIEPHKQVDAKTLSREEKRELRRKAQARLKRRIERYHRIRKIMIRAQGCVLVVGLVLGNAATLAGRVLLSIYTTSPPVIEAGLVRMGIVCTTYALCGMMDVMVGGLRGIGYSIMPMLVSLVGACGLRLLWIATIFQLPQFHTIQTIYWSYPISWAITFGVHVICFLWAMKKVKRQLLPEGASAPVEVPLTLEEETVSE